MILKPNTRSIYDHLFLLDLYFPSGKYKQIANPLMTGLLSGVQEQYGKYTPDPIFETNIHCEYIWLDLLATFTSAAASRTHSTLFIFVQVGGELFMGFFLHEMLQAFTPLVSDPAPRLHQPLLSFPKQLRMKKNTLIRPTACTLPIQFINSILFIASSYKWNSWLQQRTLLSMFPVSRFEITDSTNDHLTHGPFTKG